MIGFVAALGFLTRLPVRNLPARISGSGDLREVAAAQPWFGAVGLLIGLALLAVDRAASRALPAASVAVIDVVALVVFTGALHLDGLADAADGLFGAHSPERRLAIMHDVRVGSFGVVAIVCVLALKFAGITALPAGVRFESLILAPCLARCAMVAAIAAFPYARAEGVGGGFHHQAWPVAALAAAGTTLVAALALFGADGVYVAAFGVACGLAIGAFGTRLAGGLTGDLYGATLELSEALSLLFLAAFAERGWLAAWLLG